ncbi:MAG: hydroxysqualene dehydroxylase HpnE [Rhodospirillales bacterium]
MTGGTTYILGAGLAGLSCAVRLAQAGRAAALYEAAGHAGGRCRSFYDDGLGRRIDNGNHLLLSGNRDAFDYLTLIGASESLTGPDEALFPFVDLQTGERWTVHPNARVFPWWIFDSARRVPETAAGDYLEELRLAWAGQGARITECLDSNGVLFRRLWEPLAVSALNTAASEGAASLLWPVIRETFGRGGAACKPRVARQGLSESFIDPALSRLAGAGIGVRFKARVRALEFSNDRLAAFTVGEDRIVLTDRDAAVLAVPPSVAGDLVPGLAVPTESRAIVNGHFRLPAPCAAESFIGVIGGLCQWIFCRGDVVSTTVSAADASVDLPADEIAQTMWREIVTVLELPAQPVPPHRIVKEKRATFAQTPAQVALRPKSRTAWKNFYLAGDWTDTGLPATIEGAVRSGRLAAEGVLRFVSNS